MTSFRCFYCGGPINPQGRRMLATIEHRYKHGGLRQSDRRFHQPCFHNFQVKGGRPWNPYTEYVVLSSEHESSKDHHHPSFTLRDQNLEEFAKNATTNLLVAAR